MVNIKRLSELVDRFLSGWEDWIRVAGKTGWTFGIPFLLTGFLLAMGESLTVTAQPANAGSSAKMAAKGWSTKAEGSATHQFDAGLDSGGEFSLRRVVARISLGYRTDPSTTTAFSLGYGYAGYDFGGGGAGAFSSPWENIHSLNAGVSFRRKVSERWSLLAVPSARLVGESDAIARDALSGGGIAGLFYRFSDRLSMGPGFGAFTQLEDTTAFFPILLVNWQIAERWRFETGRGLGASLGPGLLLSYRHCDSWALMLGGRYERFRFRLDPNGSTPNGVGEDRGAALYLGTRYTLSNKGSIDVFGGVDVGGELRLENAVGSPISQVDHDVAPFVGMSASFRF